jgi:hypothetical protein
VLDLPLIVVMVMLFQRFDDLMRGTGSYDLKADIDDAEVAFDLPENTHRPWELKGRHTISAHPVAIGTVVAPPAPTHGRATRAVTRASVAADAAAVVPPLPEELRDMRFKLSWREEVRDREGVIIQVARERAAHYLKGHHPEWVLDHLPEVHSHGQYDMYSTRHIRAALKIDVAGSKVPTMLLSKKLSPFEGVEQKDLRRVIWELIRCELAT